VKNLKVSVVAYKNKIVIVPRIPEKDTGKGWYPTGGRTGDNLGCVLCDSKKTLGISQEALDLMHRVKRNHDDIGDLGWWRCDDGNSHFLGGGQFTEL